MCQDLNKYTSNRHITTNVSSRCTGPIWFEEQAGQLSSEHLENLKKQKTVNLSTKSPKTQYSNIAINKCEKQITKKEIETNYQLLHIFSRLHANLKPTIVGHRVGLSVGP